MRAPSNVKGFLIPLFVVAVMFSVLGFAVGINAFFVPFVQDAFHISTAESYLITTATFSAYIIFGIPSGRLLKRTGYKKSIFISFLLMALGMYLIVLASQLRSFPMFLLALFVNGMGQTLLNTAVNLYVTILGPEKSAAKRISIMGICNKLWFGLAPVILALFMETVDVQLKDAIMPFYGISAVFVLLGIFSLFANLPELKARGEDEAEQENEPNADESDVNTKTRIYQFPHLVLGAIAIFFYVGVETIALVSIMDYGIEIGLPSPERFTLYTSYGYFIGYAFGIMLIPKYLSQLNAYRICAVSGVLSSLLIVLVPTEISIWFLALLGVVNSLLWPAIWPLALASLGKYTKEGSALLVMGIAGGGLIPPVLGLLKDNFSYHQAYWMLFPLYLFFLYYGYMGYKLRDWKCNN